jgi:hypothetical protein
MIFTAIINEGKQTHLHSVLEELGERSGERYRLDQILLVDDQGDNVRTAVNNGLSMHYCIIKRSSYAIIIH